MSTKSESSENSRSIKQYELCLTYRNGKEFEMDKVEGDSMIEVLAKFLLVIVQVQERREKERRRIALGNVDDDIPF